MNFTARIFLLASALAIILPRQADAVCADKVECKNEYACNPGGKVSYQYCKSGLCECRDYENLFYDTQSCQCEAIPGKLVSVFKTFDEPCGGHSYKVKHTDPAGKYIAFTCKCDQGYHHNEEHYCVEDGPGTQAHNPDALNPNALNPNAQNPGEQSPNAQNPRENNLNEHNPHNTNNPDAHNPHAHTPDGHGPIAENSIGSAGRVIISFALPSVLLLIINIVAL